MMSLNIPEDTSLEDEAATVFDFVIGSEVLDLTVLFNGSVVLDETGVFLLTVLLVGLEVASFAVFESGI